VAAGSFGRSPLLKELRLKVSNFPLLPQPPDDRDLASIRSAPLSLQVDHLNKIFKSTGKGGYLPPEKLKKRITFRYDKFMQ
jgi:hypothetical protein